MKGFIINQLRKIKFRIKDPYKFHNLFQRLKKRDSRIYKFKDNITEKILYSPTLLQSDGGLIFLNFNKLYKDFSSVIKANSVIIDVGGNIGYVSRAFSLFGKNLEIFCIEPDLLNLSYASKNLCDRNNINVLHMGLSSKYGRFKLDLPKYTNERKGEKKFNTGLISAVGCKDKYGTRFFKGDDLIRFLKVKSNNLGYVKIDVEGFEKDVLFGFSQTLENSNAIFEVEINPRTMSLSNSNLNQIVIFMNKFSYYPLIEKKVDYESIENLNVFNIFFTKKETEKKLIRKLNFKRLDRNLINKYMRAYREIYK